MLGFPCNCTVTTLVGLFKCRALSGCCVATSLVACPGLSSAWELILLGGGGGWDWGRLAAVLPGLKLGNPFILLP